MGVYVDRLTEYGGSATFRWKHSCHMYADTLDELHSFAKRIGMKRAWFQDKASLPHYDLTAKRREAAVRLGAVEHCRHRMVNFMRANGHPSLRDRGPLSLEHPCCHEPQAHQATPEGQVPALHSEPVREQQEGEAHPAAS